jgi:hypothetical protein
MQTYVATIGDKAVLAFRAENDKQARALMQKISTRSELRELTDEDGKPLWDGRSAIGVREASAEEDAEWQRSRDEAIGEGEIDLDAGHDPDDWEIYFPESSKGRRPPEA